jgi:hypothetical protein
MFASRLSMYGIGQRRLQPRAPGHLDPHRVRHLAARAAFDEARGRDLFIDRFRVTGGRAIGKAQRRIVAEHLGLVDVGLIVQRSAAVHPQVDAIAHAAKPFAGQLTIIVSCKARRGNTHPQRCETHLNQRATCHLNSPSTHGHRRSISLARLVRVVLAVRPPLPLSKWSALRRPEFTVDGDH